MSTNLKNFDATEYVAMNEKAIETISNFEICINRNWSSMFNKNKMSFFIFLLMKFKKQQGEKISLQEINQEYGISLNTLAKSSKFLKDNNLIFKTSKNDFEINEEIKFAKYGENYIQINCKTKWNLLFAGNFNTLWIFQKLVIKAKGKNDFSNIEISNKAFAKLQLSKITIWNQLRLISKVLLKLDFNDVFTIQKSKYQLDNPKLETFTEEEMEEKLTEEDFDISNQLCKTCCDLKYSISKECNDSNWKHFRKNGRCYYFNRTKTKTYWKSHKHNFVKKIKIGLQHFSKRVISMLVLNKLTLMNS
ncbi:MAGa4850 family ICE element protein [Mycoplasma seminis]|uniref:Uncharacterized protein n=1 Tax=Mycoplasma seminis TaxID=512749 RepID=A0ABY9H9Q2_9MOLU|nr:hypothetical protein [Mycoplasma seminis]WLP85226.1 hypothetical protein Q8852_02800 [Mycoplasma seminis]